MLARVQSYVLQGIDALPCEVEVDYDIGSGPGAMSEEKTRTTTVGLPDTAVKESIERVRAAMGNSGYPVQGGRTLINLAPADIRKEGPLYDLPIAVGLLHTLGVVGGRGVQVAVRSARARHGVASASPPMTGARKGTTSGGGAPRPFDPFAEGVHDKDDIGTPTDADAAAIEPLDHRQYLFAGELALDGRLRPVRGVIAMAALAKARGLRGVVVPAANVAEAAVVPGVEAIGAGTLIEVLGFLNGTLEARPHAPADVESLLAAGAAPVDFADVRGQEAVKRAIVVAAAGAHNLLMLGPAGTGKTMMARALPGILPPLSPDEAIEITRIYSAAGMMPSGNDGKAGAGGAGLITVRPVRTPHHTASSAAIVGGGAIPRPGEISLAHRGVLFMDELPEFPRDVLETLRQPLEDHVVTIARSHSAVRFPASFMLVAAMNPTPKGDLPADEIGKRAMERYLSRLSGPLVDRIDIHVEAPAVPWKQLSADAGTPRGTSSGQMREQVMAARRRQAARQGGATNSRLSGRELDKFAPMTDDARTILGQAITEMGLSARAYDKVRRVSRTIADLAGADTVGAEHVGEAVQYRLLDRKL
ncbi:MAG: YifB family Mg chelatase-like AAA ATPase [Phycisphaerales bacterium]|nr:YifB family Mg chelatase-like AAA ATPase [Phycisphaerales bacterium]